MLESIVSSSYEQLKPGVYTATFRGKVAKETKNGQAYLWTFEMADGKKITRFTGEPGKPATLANRYGKWLCALAGKPLTECQVVS